MRMSVIVTDAGFQDDDWSHGFIPLADLAAHGDVPCLAVDLESDADPEALRERLGGIDLIRIRFTHFADGRGFTLARQLRRMGFGGRLRAFGHVLADQYTMARRVGFDEVEISAGLATRQPQEHWLFRSDWHTHDHQARLRG